MAEICHKDSFGRGISSLYVNSAHPFYSIFVHSILFILSFCDSVAIGKVGCNSSHLSAQMLAMRHPCMIAARPLNLRRLGVWPTCSTAVGTGKRWSGGVRAVSRAAVRLGPLISSLRSGVWIDLLCFQPQPMPKSSPARAPQPPLK